MIAHTAQVCAVAVTPDGTWIVSGSGDSTVRVWDRASGLPERTLTGHGKTSSLETTSSKSVNVVAVTPDGTKIVSGGADHRVIIWDLASGHLERRLIYAPENSFHNVGVDALAITPDGTKIVSRCNDHTIFWDLASGHQKGRNWNSDYTESTVAVTPDNTRIVLASHRDVRVRDLASSRIECQFMGHTDKVSAVAVTPDGARFISGSKDKTVRVWDIATGNLEHVLRGHTDWVHTVAVTPDGARVVSGGHDGTVRVWDLASGQEIACWVTDPGNEVLACCTVRTDASLVVYGDYAGGVHVLRLLEDQKAGEFINQPNNGPHVHSAMPAQGTMVPVEVRSQPPLVQSDVMAEAVETPLLTPPSESEHRQPDSRGQTRAHIGSKVISTEHVPAFPLWSKSARILVAVVDIGGFLFAVMGLTVLLIREVKGSYQPKDLVWLLWELAILVIPIYFAYTLRQRNVAGENRPARRVTLLIVLIETLTWGALGFLLGHALASSGLASVVIAAFLGAVRLVFNWRAVPADRAEKKRTQQSGRE
jgi:hypothetical protein